MSDKQKREAQEPETQPYVLRPGARHYVGGEPLQEGEEVELTAAEYTAFADKFMPSGKSSSKKSSGKLDPGVQDVQTPTAGSESVNPPPPKAAPTSHTPQDIGAKTPNLAAPVANPGNATRRSTTANVNAEALQGAGEPDKKEAQPQQDGPVKPGQQQPFTNSVEATRAGGVATAVENTKKEADTGKK